jgi:glycosyltransferase involved in cell wall biosynthesis
MTAAPRFSLIIPARNEAAYLPRLLDSVARARAAYPGGARAVEVIVADNASTDATARIAAERGCRVVTVHERVIAAVRNGGAAVARGDVVAFVDADSEIHPGTFSAIERALAAGCVGGGTGVRLERRALGLTVTFIGLVCLSALLVRQRGRNIPAGVVFCRRADFERIGGYAEGLRFAEDVRLILDLARLGRRRGQRLALGTDAPALFSTRKFDRYGDWHYFSLPLRLALDAVRRRKHYREYWYGG